MNSEPSTTAASSFDRVRPYRWNGKTLSLLDQRRLPFHDEWIDCADAASVAQAIRDLVVRGAPAIGIAAAYGVAMAAAQSDADNAEAAKQALAPTLDHLRAARPTAVNLAWALDRMASRLSALKDHDDWREQMAIEADAIAVEDLAANRHMGELGAALIAPGSGVLTHCNTGSLATAGLGTALGVIRVGREQGRIDAVYAGETRPWLQGARLTVWELQQDGIHATLIADSAAAHLMAQGRVQWVIIGADRITANGDVANKIGSYQLAIAARHHGVKFMVVAPSSTVDMATASGSEIEIEERDPAELLGIAGQRVVAEGIAAWNPVFDITPAGLIDAIVTERGVVERPDATSMAALFGDGAA
ncbi:MAG: S-methyl-5-thioribose-1-phosphate isomerase [Lysobacteraceae bacterium]